MQRLPRQRGDAAYNEGKNVPVMKWAGGKVVPWKGVVPWAESRLDWVFLDKLDSKWFPLKGTQPDLEQKGNGATPMTKNQLDLLKEPKRNNSGK